MHEYSNHPWLAPWEQEEVVQRLIHFNADLIKWDNKHNLPLKSGGDTDVYINIRNARNCPKANEYISKIFANPLLRLGCDRFVEVPDSVSCFAGPLQIETNIPYLTIREQVKEGRVAKAKIVGDAKFGETVTIVDDVITDGESKIEPINECLKMHLNLTPMVVLCDRQQGWKENFQNKNIGVDVWPGMTLHDVRRILIEKNLMERCDSALEKKNPLVIAHDGKSWDEILSVVDPLRTTGCIHKVNDLLFEKGMDIISDLSVYGRVLADLKCHDIPNTVENTCKRLKKYNPWGVTIHGSGHDKMIKAAVDAFAGTDTKVFAVTVLTSLKDGCSDIYQREPINEVMALAKIANRGGAHGLVCSGEEIVDLKKTFPNMELLVPALRSPDTKIADDDQQRIKTPEGAKELGADYLVMGRQITTNPNPSEEAKRVLREELGIL